MANITATAAGIGTAGDTTLGPVGVAYEMAVSSNPALRAFAHLPDTAPVAGPGGPLAGLAVGVKDIIDTADMPTGYGSRIDPAHVPAADAWIVARIRELGGT
ncbi:MAG: amidase, partial [Aurantimonas sp.]|nr:amidase [Aurantimonas sp.]